MRFLDTDVRSFNLEITNRCVLGCLECPRTGNPWVTENLTDLPLELIQRIFPLHDAARHRGLTVNLCGAYGDCIYHRQFHDVLAYLKQTGLKVALETNGSHRKPAWWQRTCELLTEEDSVTFSVDGLEDSNHVYRVNARWPDVEAAMRYCAPRVKTVWKFIVFKHNEHQVPAAQELARDIGVTDIIFKKSGRFTQDDPLAPVDENFIGVVTRNRRSIDALRAADVDDVTFDARVRIRPKCSNGKDLAITALGYLYPCTSCETSDTGTWFHRNRDHFDLRRYDIATILASAKWQELRSLWQRASCAPESCLYYCGVHQEHEVAYIADGRSDRPLKPVDSLIVNIA
jgi:MoaA/NifB/PqqE/SkfB family radical SAM enzyme